MALSRLFRAAVSGGRAGSLRRREHATIGGRHATGLDVETCICAKRSMQVRPLARRAASRQIGAMTETKESPTVAPAGTFERRVPEGDSQSRLVCRDCGFINYENPKVVVGSVC